MRTLLNLIWLVLSGFWLFLGYAAAGIVLCILIITIPWGIASLRIGVYALWPFGRTVVAKPTSGAFSFLGNVIWVVLAGWWLALAHIVSGIALCITIIGIPLGIADFKMVPISLAPLGKEIVPTAGEFDRARARQA
ncbi:YccF domain-containing protein [Cryobacterium arcticum]|uniref:YccF domain-containing protein n=1 Tax=Cryobacterium arcticum TaxID=670052 RepID=A0A317ZVB4_9MICO|nr:YccF domain-containing protein [Cryobacterium arcticum]PXA69767.1 YccF domain-containing protein [Cryobacterium arcticum]